MERLCDDELSLVLKRVSNPKDRKSCSEVCKKWWKLETLTRSSLIVKEDDPEFLPRLLRRFPNLLHFETTQLISDSNLQLLSQTNPNLQVLNLRATVNSDCCNDDGTVDDYCFTDYGLLAVANGCHDLREVILSDRESVGDAGVFALVRSNRNLNTLELAGCVEISDQTLQAIADAQTPLQVLNLQGCGLITDLGLAALTEANILQTLNKLVLESCEGITDDGLKAIANIATALQVLNVKGCGDITDLGLIALASGPVSQTLNELILSGCHQITDHGVSHLKKMHCLEVLNLNLFSPRITDTAGLVVAGIKSLKSLDLSFSFITDETLVAISHNCSELKEIWLTGCDHITGLGIRSFADDTSLETIVLLSCRGDITGEDLEHTVIRSQSLSCLMLDKERLQPMMSDTLIENIRRSCDIFWSGLNDSEFQKKL